MGGAFLHLQSPTPRLIARNTGIFWCMLQMNMIIGNLYIYKAWKGKEYVDSKMRTVLFTGFGILAGAGCFVFLLLRPNLPDESTSEEYSQVNGDDKNKADEQNEADAEPKKSAFVTVKESMVESFKLLATREMMLITALFMYSGFVLSFFSGAYPTAIGNSKAMDDPMSTVGLVGMFVGFGEVVGGGLFVFGSKIMDRIPRPILLSSCLVIHLLGFIGVIINVPLTANMGPTHDKPCIVKCILEKPDQVIAVGTGFLLGLGDAGVNNVIYTTISKIWCKNSAPAFALMKCLQSSACAISFAIAQNINILSSIGILLSFAVLTVGTYFPLTSYFQN